MSKLIQNMGYVEDNDLELLRLYHPVDEADKDKTFNVLMIDTDSTMRERLESLSRLSSEIMQDLSLIRKDYNSSLTTQGIDLRQAEMLRTLSRFIGYFFNSSSWRDNKLEYFDKLELSKRLDYVKNFFK